MEKSAPENASLEPKRRPFDAAQAGPEHSSKRRKRPRRALRKPPDKLIVPQEAELFHVYPDQAGMRLDQFLKMRLHWRSRTKVQELIAERADHRRRSPPRLLVPRQARRGNPPAAPAAAGGRVPHRRDPAGDPLRGRPAHHPQQAAAPGRPSGRPPPLRHAHQRAPPALPGPARPEEGHHPAAGAPHRPRDERRAHRLQDAPA